MSANVLKEMIELVCMFFLGYLFCNECKFFKKNKEKPKEIKKSKESEEQEYRNKFPKSDFRHYKNPEELLKENIIFEKEARKNILQNNWVNKVLNDGVLDIVKIKYPDDAIFDYKMITEHYIMKYWHVNIPYGFGQSVSIFQKGNEGNRRLIEWQNSYLTSEMRLKLYYAEENLKEIKYNGEIPAIDVRM